MIARHDGQVILVQGAIPGERVTAAMERVERQVAFASTVDSSSASPDRRERARRSVVRRLPLRPHRVRAAASRSRAKSSATHSRGWAGCRSRRRPSASSPDRGYRMRARLHVRGGRVGFFREGTHDLCDAAATGQLTDGQRGRGSANASARSRSRRRLALRDRAHREHRRRSARGVCHSRRRQQADRRGAGRGADGGRPDRRHGPGGRRRSSERRACRSFPIRSPS